MGRKHSLRSKAARLVSDLLNPISDKPSDSTPSPPIDEVATPPISAQQQSTIEESPKDSVDGPDTSSFTAFLYSFISSSDPGSVSNLDGSSEKLVDSELASTMVKKESSGRKSLFSRGKQMIGRALPPAVRFGGYRSQTSAKSGSEMTTASGKVATNEGIHMQTLNESMPLENLPEISETSLLISEKMRGVLYVSLPVVVQGKKWVLLYSTWRNGISLSTLYRRSVHCPGFSLLVVGDRKGAVFGGLIDAPMKPTSKKKYQGSNSSFVFTNTSGHPSIFRSTGANRYFTMCSHDYLALGGGGHFALYLDADLLTGSSSQSETYGNPCLAHTKDFDVKEVELWGFVYASQYEEMISQLRTEAPGICRW